MLKVTFSLRQNYPLGETFFVRRSKTSPTMIAARMRIPAREHPTITDLLPPNIHANHIPPIIKARTSHTPRIVATANTPMTASIFSRAMINQL